MAQRILHLLDSTTSPDALEILAQLLPSQPEHRLAALGHHSTRNLAALANISPAQLTFLPSAGWADPAGWRAVKKVIHQFSPTHVHAWGATAAIAVAAAKFRGPRIATLADLPSPRHLQILRLIDRRAKNNFTWTTPLPCIREQLSFQTPALLTPLAVPSISPADSATITALRRCLGIAETDGPILIMGGEGPRARYDLGLWVAGILQHLFPTLRTIVREDARGRLNPGLEKHLYTLADENMPAFAPADVPWRTLVQAADIMIVTADAPVPASSILAAIAAGIPIASGASPVVRDLLQNSTSALIAPSFKPREISAQLEALIADATLRHSIAAAAKSQHPANAAVVVDAYNALYTNLPVLAEAAR